MEEQLERSDLTDSADDPFPLRARQGVRGRGRLRPRLALLRHRQPAAAASMVFHDPVVVRDSATSRSSKSSTASSWSAMRARAIRVRRADLHRRPAALGLDADRADPREPQPGGRHAGAADARRDRRLDRPLPARPEASIRRPCATCEAKNFRAFGQPVPRGGARSTARRASRASPTSCRTISRTSASIHLILPNAKVINARRHPLDSCLGSYKQLFGKGQHFTYDMTELAALLPPVPRDDAALASRAARQGAGRALRGDGRGSRDAGAAHPRALRPAVRGRPACASTRPSAP